MRWNRDESSSGTFKIILWGIAARCFSLDEDNWHTKVLNQLTHGGLIPTLFLNGIIALSGLPWKSWCRREPIPYQCLRQWDSQRATGILFIVVRGAWPRPISILFVGIPQLIRPPRPSVRPLLCLFGKCNISLMELRRTIPPTPQILTHGGIRWLYE